MRLKVCRPVSICFYSKLVRLKGLYLDLRRLVPQFLFQIGSIKSLTSSTSLLFIKRFLFQIGSIKSIYEVFIFRDDPCFYSKLVRLKGSIAGDTGLDILGFYSKLVRLKDSNARRWWRLRLQFLFQIGSIKRDAHTGVKLLWCGFYSKLVRLKVYRCFEPYEVILSFYSKLVRLKAKASVEKESERIRFLFQIGSIKRCGCVAYPENRYDVSIPNWFD